MGVLLDLAIRRRTGNRRSLDDVLRAMNREFGRPNRPFEETAELRRVVEEVAGASFEDFFDRYIYGTEPLPYRKFFGRSCSVKPEIIISLTCRLSRPRSSWTNPVVGTGS